MALLPVFCLFKKKNLTSVLPTRPQLSPPNQAKFTIQYKVLLEIQRKNWPWPYNNTSFCLEPGCFYILSHSFLLFILKKLSSLHYKPIMQLKLRPRDLLKFIRFISVCIIINKMYDFINSHDFHRVLTKHCVRCLG